MDERLKQAIEHANYRQTLAVEKQRLKDIALADLVIAHNGGIFTVDKVLIGFVNSLKDYGSATILDDHDHPVEIEDLQQFLDKIVGHYFKVTNRYLADYNTIRQKRTAAKLVDL